MPILDLRFSNKSIHQLPHPLTGCQEYRDIHCQNLRALVYPNRITLAFRATINNQRIYETLGQFPQLCVEDARQHVMKLLADKNRLAVQSRRFTVEQAINDLWLPDLQLYKKSPQSELSKLNLYVRPFWGKRQLRDITAGELEQYAAGLREKLRPSTVNRILAILSKICSLAVRAGWITHSPMSHVRYLKENNIRYRTLSATEIPRFIDAATALQTPAADSILLALYTGMRIGEVCTLKWEYWHPDMHQLILPDTKSGHPFTCPLAPPAIAVVQCQQDLMLSKTYIFPRLTDNARPWHIRVQPLPVFAGMPTLITCGCMTCAVPLPPGYYRRPGILQSLPICSIITHLRQPVATLFTMQRHRTQWFLRSLKVMTRKNEPMICDS